MDREERTVVQQKVGEKEEIKKQEQTKEEREIVKLKDRKSVV